MMMTHGANIARSPGTNMIGKVIWKEWNVLFNDALNTCYLRLYGVGDMVKDHSDSEDHIDRIAHTTAFVTPVVEHWLERNIWRIDLTTHRTMSERSYHRVTSRFRLFGVGEESFR